MALGPSRIVTEMLVCEGLLLLTIDARRRKEKEGLGEINSFMMLHFKKWVSAEGGFPLLLQWQHKKAQRR